jgi:predicted NBD/HSP70 family sugar kinase
MNTKPLVTGSFELIKNINTSCILDELRVDGQISRADIARNTGLTPATVSNITAELIKLGLIIETERGISSGGRKPVMLSINTRSCYFAGVHISYGMLEVAIVDVDVEIIWQEKWVISPGTSDAKALEQAIVLIKKAIVCSKVGSISGIGVCLHGLVKSEEGLLVFAPNLGWENVRVGDTLANEFNLPVVVENDVRAMTVAESWCGLARNVRNYVYLYIGPGIGGSIVLNGELYKGDGGFAGEFGHNTIMPDGPLCSCGNRGCLQAIASETVILSNFISRKNDIKYAKYTFDDVLKAAKENDPVAVDEIIKSVRHIGTEVGNIINSLSPSMIIINGKLTGLGGIVMTSIDDEVRRRSIKYSQNNTRIVFSRLGETAQIKGAASCMISEMFACPKKFLTPSDAVN